MATFTPSTIIAAIGDMSVSGWTIYDLTNIPEQLDIRATAALFPDIANLITELSIVDATFGSHAAGKNAAYTLNYVFAYKNVEAGRTIGEYTSAMVSAVETLIETLVTTSFASAGAVEINPTNIVLGLVKDPAGTDYFGGLIKLRVLEFIT